MGYWAKVISNGDVQEVVNVIVADADFFTDFIDTSPGTWIETFKEEVDNPRKNYADIGGTYRADLNAFVPKKVLPDVTNKLDRTNLS